MGLVLIVTAKVEGATSLDHWRNVCEDFSLNYSYTEHKGIHWTNVFQTNSLRFEGELSSDQFATNLNEALKVLHDWHVVVQKSDGTFLGFSAALPRNYPAAVVTNLASSAYENYRGAGALYHARLTNGVHHVIIPTLDTATFNRLSDADLLSFFESNQAANGMIIDLRYNAGGNELHGRRLASYFVQPSTVYGFVRLRAPSEPDGFLPLAPRFATTNGQLRLDYPVVVLTGQACLSSGEWLTLMLREAPNAILMGDRTRGASGGPALRSIPELRINYRISTWIAYTPETNVFEDVGILPAIHVRPDSSYDDAAGRDFLLEHAMDYIAWRRANNANALVNWRTDSDGDGVRDVDEFVARTDPANSASTLALGISRLTSSLTWNSASRRSYTILRASEPTGPWLEFLPGNGSSGAAQVPLDGADGFFRLRLELSP